MNEALQSLCLFLTTGRTYTFRDVVIECDNETVIAFTYHAMSDGRYKHGTFYKVHIAGVAKFGLPMEKAQCEKSLLPSNMNRKEG